LWSVNASGSFSVLGSVIASGAYFKSLFIMFQDM
jgi:hypothetical protein